MSAPAEESGGALRPALTFSPAAARLVAIVPLAEVPGEATLVIEWTRLDGTGTPEQLFVHQVAVTSRQRAYSIGVSPGILAEGFYEVTASLAHHSVTALWRVAPSAGDPAGFRAPSRTAAPVGEEGDAQPPTSGDSGALDAGNATDEAALDCQMSASCADDTGFDDAPTEDTTPYPPCRLHSIDGHGFLVVVLEFIVFYDWNVAGANCPHTVVSATVEGPPVVVGEYDGGTLDLLDPCALPGGSDMPGTVVHFSGRYADDPTEVARGQALLEDLNEEILIHLTSPTHAPGSKVEPGETIEIVALLVLVPPAPGIRSVQILSPDGELTHTEYERSPCDPQRNFREVRTTYTVPDDPPAIIQLRVVADDYADRNDTEVISFTTEDASTWSGTFSGSWNTATENCSGSDFEGKVQLTVVDDTVTGTMRLSEAVDCLGFNYVPYPGYAEFDGAFDGEQFLLTVTRLEGGVNAWACLSQDAPAISVLTPDSASAQWTAALPPDSSFDCRIILTRDQPKPDG